MEPTKEITDAAAELADGVPKEDLLKAMRDSLETFEGHMKDAAYELCTLQELAKRKGGKHAAVVGNIAGTWWANISPIIGTRSKSVPTVDGVYAWLKVSAEEIQ